LVECRAFREVQAISEDFCAGWFGFHILLLRRKWGGFRIIFPPFIITWDLF
jgi:hypothetical protein